MVPTKGIRDTKATEDSMGIGLSTRPDLSDGGSAWLESHTGRPDRSSDTATPPIVTPTAPTPRTRAPRTSTSPRNEVHIPDVAERTAPKKKVPKTEPVPATEVVAPTVTKEWSATDYAVAGGTTALVAFIVYNVWKSL